MTRVDEIKEQLEAAFSKLKFIEKGHRYMLSGQRIPSTSAKLKSFYKPFDDNIAFYVAGKGKYKGMSPIDVLFQWEDKSKKAMAFGTRTHEFAEEYAIRCIRPSNNAELGAVQWWMDMPEHFHLIETELTMYSEEFKYGGTADVILYNELDDTLVIADYKTNEDLFKNYKNKKMLEPFTDKLDTPFAHYELQFSHYQMCLEEKGFNISRRILIHLQYDEETNKYYKNYNTDDLTEEIKEHYGHYSPAY